AEALPMEGYRNDDVSLQVVPTGFQHFDDPVRKPPAQWLDPFKLQCDDGPDEFFFVLRVTTGTGEGVGSRCAVAADPLVRPRTAFGFLGFRCSERSLECCATDLTKPPLNQRE